MEASGSARVEDLLAQLTLEEKVAMAAGRDLWLAASTHPGEELRPRFD